VETASSVREAFGKMGKAEYDVVVCDYHKPETNGLHFLKKLREKSNRVSFVIFSGKIRMKPELML
jgi:YesN/AraC family two-component response regulator